MIRTRALPGIHHLTAIAGDPQQNVDFYMGVLGLRLVKQTVNFDDPQSYHLYYGDDTGRPGTILTFFSWPGAPRGSGGVGQIGVTAFSVPAGALPFWQERLAAHGIQPTMPEERFADQVLAFVDPDGLPLEVIATEMPDIRPGWSAGPVPARYAIRGFHAPTLHVSRLEPSMRVLSPVMGFRAVTREGARVRFAMGAGSPGSLVDVVERPGIPYGRMGVGTAHHIAWRTPDDVQQLAWHDDLAAYGLGVTEVRDRHYFRSIYYREPGGIVYEIATDQPGFAIDEAPEALGTALQLPIWLEPQRAQIARALPPIVLPGVTGEAVR